MISKTKLCVVLFLLFAGVKMCQEVRADELDVRLGLMGLSYHFDDDYDYNEVNPGVYLYVEKFMIGTYDNSYNEQSTFVGYMQPIVAGVDLFAGRAFGGYEQSADSDGDDLWLVALSYKTGPVRGMLSPKGLAFMLEF